MPGTILHTIYMLKPLLPSAFCVSRIKAKDTIHVVIILMTMEYVRSINSISLYCSISIWIPIL